MDTSTLPQRLTDRKRAAIVDAAIEEFLASGYDATSMDRIAARADVSKRTVYNHFPGKETLFAAILQNCGTRPGQAVRQPIVPMCRCALLALLDRKMRLLSDEAFLSLARVAIGAAIHSPERARDMVERLGEREKRSGCGRPRRRTPVRHRSGVCRASVARCREGIRVLAADNDGSAAARSRSNRKSLNPPPTCFSRTTRSRNIPTHRAA